MTKVNMIETIKTEYLKAQELATTWSKIEDDLQRKMGIQLYCDALENLEFLASIEHRTFKTYLNKELAIADLAEKLGIKL
jgi:hypothetical protein